MSGAQHAGVVDDIRFGGIVRAARIRRGWRQQDLADLAGVSRGTVSRIERGKLHELSIGRVRAVCQALEIRVEMLPRSRHADIDRMASAHHAALAEFVVGWLAGLEGWVVRPEVSFAFYADRGIVDVLAWHEKRAAILIIELKTEIIDVGELLGTLDRKRRVATRIAHELGWRADVVGACLLIGDSMTNRRRVDTHAATFRAALPQDGRALRGWLCHPTGDLRAMRFVPDARPGNVRSGFAAPRRVSTRSKQRSTPAGRSARARGPIESAAAH